MVSLHAVLQVQTVLRRLHKSHVVYLGFSMQFIIVLAMPLVYDAPFILGIFETLDTFVMKTTLICASPSVCHKAYSKLLSSLAGIVSSIDRNGRLSAILPSLP